MFEVVIPVGTTFIALNAETFEQARQRARELLPVSNDATPAPEKLLTADGLAELLGVPTSQVETLGRQGRIPSVTVGKYRRYSYTQALAALRGSG